MSEKKENHQPTSADIGTDEKESKISERQIPQERFERLRNMGRVVGEDFQMEVRVGNKPGWRYVFEPADRIEVDPEALVDRGLDYCFGIICHEGAHKKISQISFIPRRVRQTRGFSFLCNAIEDPRVNNWVMRRYRGARDWLEKSNAEDLTRLEDKAKLEVGYIPKHMQFGYEVIRYWFTGVFSADLPSDVREALDKTIKFSQMAYESIPNIENPSNEDILKNAKQAYRIIYSAIWPEYEKLVDESLDEETMRQLIKEMIENGEIEISDEAQGENGEPLPLDQLPEDLRKELEEKIKQKIQEMDEEEARKWQEEAQKRAKEILDEIEDEANEELRGKFSDQPESKRKEEERQKKEVEAKQKEAELEARKKAIEEQLEAKKTEYDRAYEKIQPLIEKVADEIINLFIHRRWPQFKKGFPGQTLRLKGAMRYAAKKEYNELFETRSREERKDYHFTLLVDLSGSMRGEKIEQTFLGTVLFAEVLERVSRVVNGLNFSIYGFQEDILAYKKFNQSFDSETRQQMSSMKNQVNSENPYTNLGYCLHGVSQELDQYYEGDNFIFVISDGRPESQVGSHLSGFNSSTVDNELHYVVREISAKANQHLLAIGLGQGTDHVRTFFPDSLANVDNLPNINVQELAKVIASKIEQLVQ